MSWKQKIRRAYVHHRNRFLKGYQELSMLNGLFNSMMVLWIFLKATFGIPNRYFWVLPIVGCVMFLTMYAVGWAWDHFGFFKEDYKWVSNRNPVMMEMYNELKELIEKVRKT